MWQREYAKTAGQRWASLSSASTPAHDAARHQHTVSVLSPWSKSVAIVQHSGAFMTLSCLSVKSPILDQHRYHPHRPRHLDLLPYSPLQCRFAKAERQTTRVYSPSRSPKSTRVAARTQCKVLYGVKSTNDDEKATLDCGGRESNSPTLLREEVREGGRPGEATGGAANRKNGHSMTERKSLSIGCERTSGRGK